MGKTPAVAEALIAHGANIKATETDDWTALHFAAAAGITKIVNALIAAGASVDAMDNVWIKHAHTDGTSHSNPSETGPRSNWL